MDLVPARFAAARSGPRPARPYVRLTQPRGTIISVRILVVEDEASLRDGIVDLLTGDGHQLVAVGDGVAGVEAGLRDPFDPARPTVIVSIKGAGYAWRLAR
jgi:hypothetical protein